MLLLFFYVNAIDVLDPIRLKELGGCDVVEWAFSFLLFNNYDSLVIMGCGWLFLNDDACLGNEKLRFDSQITRLR